MFNLTLRRFGATPEVFKILISHINQHQHVNLRLKKLLHHFGLAVSLNYQGNEGDVDCIQNNVSVLAAVKIRNFKHFHQNKPIEQRILKFIIDMADNTSKEYTLSKKCTFTC